MATQNSTGNVGFPDLVSIQPFATPISSVGTWGITTNSSSIKNGYIRNSSPAINDELVFNATLGPGTWTCELIVRTTSDSPIVHIELDGTEEGTLDTWSAGTTENVSKELTGIAVDSGGVKEVTLKNASKNVSSSNYQLFLVGIYFRRTGA